MATEKKTEVELDWEMNPIERLESETKALHETDFMGVAIAAYISAEMNKDENLAKAYKERKVTLNSILEFVMAEARKRLNGKNGQIPDAEVYGWAIHFIIDGKIPKQTGESLKLTISQEDREAARQEALKKLQEEELAKLRKAEAKKLEREKKKVEAAKKKAEEEERRRKEAGYMSLFDFIGEGGEA